MTQSGVDRSKPAAFIGFLGAAGIALGLAIASPILERLRGRPDFHEPLAILMDLLALWGLVGLWSTCACGGGVVARFGLGLAILGSAASAVAQSLEALGHAFSLPLFEFVVTPTSIIGLFVAAVAMVLAHCWRGWHRFTLLATAIWFPVFGASHVVVPLGPARYAALAIWGLCYLSLGLAMRAETKTEPVPASPRW